MNLIARLFGAGRRVALVGVRLQDSQRQQRQYAAERVALKARLSQENQNYEAAFRNGDMPSLHRAALETQKLARQVMLLELQWQGVEV